MRIDAALERLPAKVKEVFLLSQFEGVTYSQIALRRGISVATVRKYMFKAVQACYEALGDVTPSMVSGATQSPECR